MRRVIATTPLRADEELRVLFDEFKRRTYLHVRRYFRADSGGMQPSNKGITVTPDLLPWLRAQLEQAEATALEGGLLEIEDYTNHGLDVPDALRRVA